MTDQQFFDEVKQQFSRHLRTRHNLDLKANATITMAATIATLLSGFTAILGLIINPGSDWFFILLGIPIGGISSLVVTIFICSQAYQAQIQQNPIIHDAFFPSDDVNNFNEKVVEEHAGLSDVEFRKYYTQVYLECIKSCADAIENKTKKIKAGQYFFKAGILSMPITGGLLLSVIASGVENVLK